MNFVVDASLALAFVLDSEKTEQTDTIFETFRSGAMAYTPALWRWEVANSLLVAERRNRIEKATREAHLASFQKTPILIDEAATDAAWNETVRLAEKHSLTTYDAAYLELAIRRSLPLGSLDQQLRQAAQKEGVKLLPA